MSTGQWYHVALSGSDGSYKLFLNGTQEGSTATGSITDGHDTKKIGVFWYSGGGYIRYWNGYLEDFRITKGLARYTSNFTPPTSAHSTQAGDINKHIVVNSDADGVAIGTGGINQARIAKAWINYNGTTASIRDSYNIGSITDNGTGQHTINYSTAMSDANYSIVVFAHDDQTGGYWWRTAVSQEGVAQAAGSFKVETIHPAENDVRDTDTVCAQIFGN